MNIKIIFSRERFNALVFMSVVIILIGSAVASSDQNKWLKFLQPMFAGDLVRIDKGLAELNFLPNGNKEATLDDSEPGFIEILNIIRQHDKFVPSHILKITQRLDFIEQFYWAKKGMVGVICLHLTENANDQSKVYPVNLASTVFLWITQERADLLARRGFNFILVGSFFSLLACFLKFEIKSADYKKQIEFSAKSLIWVLWGGLFIFYTALFLFEKIGVKAFLFLLCVNMFFLFGLLGFPRLKEFDMKNMRLILNEIKEARDEIFAKEKDLREVAQFVFDTSGFLSLIGGRMGSQEHHNLRRDWIKAQLSQLKDKVSLDLTNLEPYERLFAEIDKHIPEASNTANPGYAEAKEKCAALSKEISERMRTDAEKIFKEKKVPFTKGTG